MLLFPLLIIHSQFVYSIKTQFINLVNSATVKKYFIVILRNELTQLVWKNIIRKYWFVLLLVIQLML